MNEYFQEGQHELKLPIPKFMLSTGEAADLGDAIAPMPGVIEKVTVEPGSKVEKGDPLVVMIAMKMEVCKQLITYTCIVLLFQLLSVFLKEGFILLKNVFTV